MVSSNNLPKPKDYKKFFTTIGTITCLHSEFLMKGSLGKSELLVTNRDKFFNIYYRTKKESICLEAGNKLYSSKESYRKYLSDFKDYMNEAYKIVIPKYSSVPKKISKKELIDDLEFISKFWHFYGITEFPYVDLAYETAKLKSDKETIKRLDEMSRFKFKAREVLNHYFFKNGVIQNILQYVSKKFLSYDIAFYLFRDEIIDCFDGKLPDMKKVNERRKFYSALVKNGKIQVYGLTESKKINEAFTKLHHSNIIHGTVANPGKARGRAVISPMLTDPDEIRKIDKIMKKGDILIAETTSPDTIMLCKKAAAIVADEGGMLSHAAVISREFKIPCIVSANIATQVFKNGDIVEVDADHGIVRKIDK